jgi:UDP-N-acetylglucosamine diphosphorylase/glucosamine-1-phosphate N-acetyltransferase
MSSLQGVILAAGKGTRMESDLPKVAHEVAGRPMVLWVADACAAVGCERVVVVVGHRQEVVRSVFDRWDGGGASVEFAVQEPQLGTGHAVQCAAPGLAGSGGDAFVLAGDGPLIRPETLAALLDRHRSTGAAATLATAVLDDPTGYGRIVRDASGAFEAIVEHKDCDASQRAIREVNPSYYCFGLGLLLDALGRVGRNEGSGEYYITDVPGLLLGDGRRVEVIDAVPAEDVLSINTPRQLAEVDRVLRSRLSGAARIGGAAR